MAGRVRILTHEFPPQRGGIATYAEAMARTAAEMGYDVEVWAPGLSPQSNLPYKTFALNLKGSQDWPCRFKLAAQLRRMPDDWSDTILYLPEPGPIRAWLYADNLKLPKPGFLSITLHGSELMLMLKFSWRRRRLKKLLDRCDRIGVVSQYVEKLLLEFAPQVKEKCLRVPGAPAQPIFDIDRIPFQGEKRSIICVGRIHPRKGQRLLVEAVSLLPEDLQKQCTVQLIGPNSRPGYLEEIQKLAQKSKVNLNYCGSLSDSELIKAYSEADILVMPSQQQKHSVEGLGLALLEGAAAGLPTIASRSGGTSEALADQKTGCLVEEGSAEAIAKALSHLLQNPQTAIQRGKNGRQWVAENFSWQENANRLFPAAFPTQWDTG
jgi:glycosyltransferase involved in cell wall biosynthesis